MVKEAATEDRMNMILVTMDAGTMAGTVVVMMMDDVDMEEGEMSMKTTITAIRRPWDMADVVTVLLRE